MLLLLLACPVLLLAQSNSDTLTNQTIIQLTKIGLEPSVIINKLKSSTCSFDISTNALIRLNENQVSPEVINEMIKNVSNLDQNTVKTINIKDPNQPHRSGIYYFNQTNSDRPLSKIQVVRVSSYESGGGGYGGFGGTSTLAVLAGKTSRQQISSKSPIFYFYFNPENNLKDDWFENAASPNEFSLVKVIMKKDKRLFKVGGGSSYGYGTHESAGIPEKTKIDFKFEQISEGIFKITFTKPLSPGEYCFVFASETDKVFDFGIAKE